MKLFNRLSEIQQQHGWLPPAEIQRISEESGIPAAQILGSASFYTFFRWERPQEGQWENHTEKIYPLRREGILLQSEDDRRWEALKKAREAREKVIPEITASGLLGRSGSAFPAGVKWKLTAEAPAEEKYVVCNADEGEPGTGKDRAILERNPYAVVEGMAICAAAVGASKGYLYLREEYADLKENLERVIAEAPLEDFQLEVYMGHGAYVCGEETALLNSLEGKRGETRLKPPFPGVAGAWGRPTVLNNVETFLCVPLIIREGAAYFRTFGTSDYPGPKLFTIFGAVQAPGVYELNPGLTLKECVLAAGGFSAPVQAFLTGGGSGTLVRPDKQEMIMTPKGCAGEGGSFGVASIRVLSQRENMVMEVRKLTEFFARESCGTCPPCRIGLEKMAEILRKAENQMVWPEEILQLKELTAHIPSSARCGLGLAAVTPVKTLLENFPEVLS